MVPGGSLLWGVEEWRVQYIRDWRTHFSNTFNTAVPFWGETAWNLSGLPPKWGRSSRRVKDHPFPHSLGDDTRQAGLSRGTILGISIYVQYYGGPLLVTPNIVE